jgi:hypothetical protein
MKGFLSRKKGIALVSVILLMAILSILGLALLNVSLFETKVSVKDAKKLEAYYLAKSGAYSTAKKLMLPSSDTLVDSFLSAGVADSQETALGGGKFKVKVTKIDVPNQSPKLKIESIGIIPYLSSTIEQKETVVLEKINLFNRAIFASGNINNASNSYINGDIEARGTIANKLPPQVNSSAIIIENSPRTYPGPVLPNTIEFENKIGINETEFPGIFDAVTNPHMPNHPALYSKWEVDSNLTVRDNNTYVSPNIRYGNYKYNELEIKSSRKLTFDISKDMRIYVNSFNALNAELEVKSTSGTQGKLYIYVDSNFKFYGNIISPPETFYLIAADGANIEMQTGNQVFNGYIYAPGANLDYKSGTYSGAIVCNNMSLGSSGSISYNGTGISNIIPESLGLNSFGYKMGLWGKN